MESNNAEMQQVMERLARVEKQNRWLVRGGVALVLCCASLLLMAPKPSARTIEAQSFVLRDDAGSVRAELHMKDKGPELALYPAYAGPKAAVKVGLSLNEDGPELVLYGGPKKMSAVLTAGDQGADLYLGSAEDGHASAELRADKDGPNLSLKDSEGFLTAIGTQELVSPTAGQKVQTSAASIYLLDSKRKILWSAP
jgi:hypothetical protein